MSDEATNPTVYWLTRDENEQGEVSDLVSVWLEAPARQGISGIPGALWYGAKYAQWPLDIARKNNNSGVVPENSRECIRVG